MTNWKRIKRLWTLLSTDEVFDEHGVTVAEDRVLRGAARKARTVFRILASAEAVGQPAHQGREGVHAGDVTADDEAAAPPAQPERPSRSRSRRARS